MDTALITALAAVMGSVVGGSATVATAWISQTTQSKREVALLRFGSENSCIQNSLWSALVLL